MIYLDNASGMKLLDNVKEKIVGSLDDFYNPSSAYSKAQLLSSQIDDVRLEIANSLNANPNNVIFTSGATEANNLAILGYHKIKKNNYSIAYLGFDHNSITKPINLLKKEACDVIKLNYNDFIDRFDYIIDLMKEKKVSFLALSHIYANVGVQLPIEKIVRLLKKELPRLYIHVDAAQSFMKEDIELSNIDSISISAHKIGALKGVGALILRNNQLISPLLFGGKHNFSLRAGTENVLGILSFKEAIKKWLDNKIEFRRSLLELNTYFKSQYKILFEGNDNVKIITPMNRNYCNHIVTIGVKNILSEHLIRFLDENNIYVSATSTCSDLNFKPPFLSFIKLDQAFHKGIIRISFSPYNQNSDIDEFLKKFQEAILYFF